ncbi:LPS translocon maturation chaperone LptM [Marinomonas epiphytica]
MLKWFFMVFFALFIVACGNKGALYLPTESVQIESLSSAN